APAAVFRTSDGYVHLFVSTKHWPSFLDAWDGHPAELEDPSWRSNDARRAAADWLNGEVEAFVGRHSTASFVALMERFGIPCLPVNSPADVLTDEHMAARGAFVESSYP